MFVLIFVDQFGRGILPEWSKGADLRSARQSSAWVQTPQVPSYRSVSARHLTPHRTTPSAQRPRHTHTNLLMLAFTSFSSYSTPFCIVLSTPIALSPFRSFNAPLHCTGSKTYVNLRIIFFLFFTLSLDLSYAPLL